MKGAVIGGGDGGDEGGESGVSGSESEVGTASRYSENQEGKREAGASLGRCRDVLSTEQGRHLLSYVLLPLQVRPRM